MDAFSGHKKEGTWLLKNAEDRLRIFLVPLVPRSIETYHLTMMTVLWSFLVIVGSFLATKNLAWIFLASGAIFLQYVTVLIDGAVGRARNTGLVKWGFYMDHFLDFVFLSSMAIGYFFFVPAEMLWWTYAALILATAFLVSSFLEFAATNNFKISFFGIGPTESRLGLIFFNTAVFFFGGTIVPQLLPYFVSFGTIMLLYVLYQKQCMLWKIDMGAKKNSR